MLVDKVEERNFKRRSERENSKKKGEVKFSDEDEDEETVENNYWQYIKCFSAADSAFDWDSLSVNSNELLTQSRKRWKWKKVYGNTLTSINEARSFRRYYRF